MDRTRRTGVRQGDLRSYALQQNRRQSRSRSRSPLLRTIIDYKLEGESLRSRSRSPVAPSNAMYGQRHIIPITSDYVWNPERREEPIFPEYNSSGNIGFNVHQPVSLDYNHGTSLSIDYDHRKNMPDDTAEVDERLSIDYDHRIIRRPSSAEAEHRLGGSRSSSSRSDQRLDSDSRSLAAAASMMSSLQETAAEIIRIQNITRNDQIRIYKESKEYKMFDERFPKHNRRYKRPTTPDRVGIPVSEWMSQTAQWQKDIKDMLDENNVKSKVVEEDEEVLLRRQKNVDYCKSSEAYAKYVALIPKSSRGKRDPRTPDKFQIYSRRCWDGAVKAWKIRIHRRLEELTDDTKS